MRPLTQESLRLTPVSYTVLLLLAVAWPATSFYFIDAQAELVKDVTNPLHEIYYPTIIFQLLTVLLVLIALRSEKSTTGEIGLTRFTRWTFLQAVAFFVAANVILTLLQTVIFLQSPESLTEIRGLLPHTSFERVIWVILCTIVAFSEEVTFRGYILTRAAHLVHGRAWVGVLVATAAFASGHLYQGIGGFVLIFIYGLMFAALYLYTRSLLPGMIAHFLQDISALLVPDL